MRYLRFNKRNSVRFNSLTTFPVEGEVVRRSLRLSAPVLSSPSYKSQSQSFSFLQPDLPLTAEAGDKLISLDDIWGEDHIEEASSDEETDPTWGKRKSSELSPAFASYLSKNLRAEYEETTTAQIREFLNMVVTSYNSGQPDLLVHLLSHLENSQNRTFFSSLLRDKPVMHSEDLFPTGKHEWLPCQLIRDVLIRCTKPTSLLRVPDHIGIDPDSSGKSWLDIFFDFRSETRTLFFNSDDGILRDGHVPAIGKKSPSGKFHPSSKGSPALHQALCKAFKSSKSPQEFFLQAMELKEKLIYQGKTTPRGTKSPRITALKKTYLNLSTPHRRSLKEALNSHHRNENKRFCEMFAGDSGPPFSPA